MTGLAPAARRLGGRLGGYLFLGAGAVTLTSTVVSRPVGVDVGALVAVSVVSFAVGGLAMVAPWDRWPSAATLVLVPLAFALITIGNVKGGDDPYTYAVYFVVVFVWLGVAQPRGTALKLAAAAAIAYVLPFLFTEQVHPSAIGSTVVAIPVCVLVSETIAAVLEKARRAEALAAHRAAGMQALAEAETTMQAETDARRVGERAAALAVAILGASAGAVVVDDPGDGSAVLGTSGLDVDTALRAAAAFARTGEVDPTMLMAPIPGQAGPIGTLVVSFGARPCPDDGFTEPAARLFANKVARAVEQIRVVEALTDAAVRDGLTGIGNRRHGDGLLASLLPGDAVVLVDLDHFKQVNDTLGHPAGDAVLVAVGRYLREHLRRNDDVARIGGEEFLVVLRQEQAPLAAAARLVEGWRAVGAATTISAGVAVHAVDRAATDTLQRADAALYQAKRAGRDRAAAADAAVDVPHQ